MARLVDVSTRSLTPGMFQSSINAAILTGLPAPQNTDLLPDDTARALIVDVVKMGVLIPFRLFHELFSFTITPKVDRLLYASLLPELAAVPAFDVVGITADDPWEPVTTVPLHVRRLIPELAWLVVRGIRCVCTTTFARGPGPLRRAAVDTLLPPSSRGEMPAGVATLLTSPHWALGLGRAQCAIISAAVTFSQFYICTSYGVSGQTELWAQHHALAALEANVMRIAAGEQPAPHGCCRDVAVGAAKKIAAAAAIRLAHVTARQAAADALLVAQETLRGVCKAYLAEPVACADSVAAGEHPAFARGALLPRHICDSANRVTATTQSALNDRKQVSTFNKRKADGHKKAITLAVTPPCKPRINNAIFTTNVTNTQPWPDSGTFFIAFAAALAAVNTDGLPAPLLAAMGWPTTPKFAIRDADRASAAETFRTIPIFSERMSIRVQLPSAPDVALSATLASTGACMDVGTLCRVFMHIFATAGFRFTTCVTSSSVECSTGQASIRFPFQVNREAPCLSPPPCPLPPASDVARRWATFALTGVVTHGGLPTWVRLAPKQRLLPSVLWIEMYIGNAVINVGIHPNTAIATGKAKGHDFVIGLIALVELMARLPVVATPLVITAGVTLSPSETRVFMDDMITAKYAGVLFCNDFAALQEPSEKTIVATRAMGIKPLVVARKRAASVASCVRDAVIARMNE